MSSRFHYHTPLDRFICSADKALRVLAGVASASRPTPAAHVDDAELTDKERKHSAGLIRVDHVGEVMAQALYNSQARFARSDALREKFEQASREEEDHLAWTAQRLKELNSQTSVLAPLFYAGAYALGTVAAKMGDAHSLGFVVETERQVERHLESHLDSLPAGDAKSRAIVDQMRIDEIAHGKAAQDLGAADTPAPVKVAMQAMSKLMTGTTYYI
ncbi:ubiquinone biosynthesis monooxygenase Coq7 [Pseudoduganella flava]|uniref:3-demethoxyubiquinol 3-hydroxylase n=1 Tax=Pseudoduganella flava TaxID=871742 RepID=A0A562Q317_9BURK|nr:2-polyprenyl-3-methyl-6-methoxy-1,4-benzoquinone monooxygenase [Pseudoduganella flava]QGZ41156.1 2-polyprenyl-3-methyl-6-methoxy-1,4-benzoquinone monooxygenase [Pseudoduganella flava]TWI51087.1 ubiquinone biosynthesis monooxygenase Coq7 [Pseudoduganella flava]